MSSTNYIIIPNTHQKVYENSVVVLFRLPDTKWILHCGYYTYNGVKQKGWYFASIPAETVMPVFEEDLVAMKVISGSPVPPYPPCPPPGPFPPYPPCPPGPHPPFPPAPIPIIFTPEDKRMIDASMITVPSLEERDRLSSFALVDGKICRVNDSGGQVEYYEWDSKSYAWIPATLGYRYMTRDEVTEELNGTIVDIQYSDSNGLLTLVKYDRTVTDVPFAGIAHHPTFEDLRLTIPVFGKEDVVVDIPKGSEITNIRIEDSYEITPGVFVPALIITEEIDGVEREVVLDATKFYNLFSSIAETKSVKLFVNSATSTLEADVKIATVANNAIQLDDTGLFVDITGKVDKKDINEGYVLVADGFGGFTSVGDVHIVRDGNLSTSDAELVTANIISAAIQAAVEAVEGTIESQIEELDRRVSYLEDNFVGPGEPDQLVVSTSTGIARSGYSIGGNELTGEDDLLATEGAIQSKFAWKPLA